MTKAELDKERDRQEEAAYVREQGESYYSSGVRDGWDACYAYLNEKLGADALKSIGLEPAFDYCPECGQRVNNYFDHVAGPCPVAQDCTTECHIKDEEGNIYHVRGCVNHV